MFSPQSIKEAGLERVVRQMPAGVILVDAQTQRVVLANERAREIVEQNLGYSMPQELAGFDDFRMFHPDGRPCGLEEAPLARSLGSGEEVKDEEYFYLLADGGRRWLRLDSSPIHDDEGSVAAATLIMHDVTEQKRSEERLAYHAGLLENMHDAAIATDEHFAVTAWNRGAEELYGYSSEEALGRNVLEVAPGQTSEEEWGGILAELGEAGRNRIEMDTHRRDGTPLRIEATAVALHDERGRITGYFTIDRDVTERRRHEMEQRKLAQIVQSSSDFIGICDLDRRVTFVNEAGRRMVGLEGIEEARNTEVLDYFAPGDRAFVRDELLPRIMEEGRWAGERELNLRNFRSGETIPVTWDAFRIDDPRTGEPVSIATVTRDITERKRYEEELRRSRRRKEDILESITDSFYALDREWRLTYVNEQALRVFKQLKGEELTREELLGRNIWEVFPEVVGTLAYEKYHQAVREQETLVFEYPYPGEGPWFDIHAYPSEQGLSLYFRDVTERKLAQEAAHEAQESLSIAIEAAQMGTWDLDLVNDLSSRRSPRHDQLFGYEEPQSQWGEEITKRHVLEADRDTFDAAFSRARETGELAFEVRVRWPEGSIHWMAAYGRFYFDEDGEPVRGAGVNFDITERKRYEEELFESEGHLRFVLAAGGLGNWRLDLQTYELSSSENCKANFGLPLDAELSYEKLRSMIHPDDSDSMQAAMERTISTGEDFESDYRITTPANEARWVSARGRVVYERDGEPQSVSGITQDITWRKRDEERLRESYRRVEDILESITDEFMAVDHEWRFTYINERSLDRMRRIKGEELTREALLGESCWEMFPELLGTTFHHELHRALREQRTVRFDTGFPPGDSWLAVHAYPAEYGLSIYSRDVTERKRARREIESRAHQQAAVAEFGIRALSNHGLEPLMDEAVALIARTLGVEYCKIVELLPDGAGGEEFLLRSGVGFGEGLVGEATGRLEDDPQVGYTLRSSEPVIVEDLAAETRFGPSPLLREYGVVSGVTVVIPGRNGPFGALGAHTATRRTFSADDANFLQSVANVLAAAVERRESEERLVEVREAERGRIARDLHDEALRELTNALAQAQRIRQAWQSPDPTNRTGSLVSALKQTAQQVRGAIYDLRLGDERERPFSELLEALVAHHREMAPDCDISLEVDDGVLDGPLGDAGRELLRILGEALTNARRHSGAWNVSVTVWSSEDRLHAEVSDDGRGFELPREASGTGGTGMRSMRERARALGGELEIRSRPGEGTEVSFELGLPKDREEPTEEEPEEEVHVLLVEDHASVREAIASTFEREAGFTVTGHTASLEEARRLIEIQPVDVAVVDLGLSDGYGGDLIKALRDTNPRAQALVLSANLDRAEVARAVESGAAGVLHKTAHLDEVAQAVRRLRAGETLMELEEVVKLLRFAGTKREEEHEAQRAIESLTPREIEVLQLLAEGLDSAGIAERLRISLRTERNHISNILPKLGVHSQLQALVFALRYGVLEIR